MRNNHTPDPERVCGCGAGEIEERADDISRAITQEKHGVGDDFLGVPRGVGNGEREDEHEGRIVGSCQEVADVAADVVGFIDEAEAERAGDLDTQVSSV